jgi:HK97 family phage prohead protease
MEGDGLERRFLAAVEVRVSESEQARPVISGYGAMFNSLSLDLGGFRERIRPGAFAESISTDDIRGLFNHDANFVLGRTTNGTLRLMEDGLGLQYTNEPPDTQWARDLLTSIQRGDISQMSFGFVTLEDAWMEEAGIVVRELRKVKLFDVGPVTFPAYPQTLASARSALPDVETLARMANRTQEERSLIEKLLQNSNTTGTPAAQAGSGALELDQVKVRLAMRRRRLDVI